MHRRALPALLLAALSLLAAGLPLAPAGAAPPAGGAWARLAHLRHELAAQHLVADFTQTFRPAGFEQVETESGRLYLALPDCLLWEYRAPEAKNFLICGPDLYAWIPGDSSGRHTVIEPREEPGLDLLLLSVDDLSQRYDINETGDSIELRPRDSRNSIRQASFLLAAGGKRLAALQYTDLEDNRTRFDLAGWKPLAGRSLFEPPPIQWASE